MKVLEKRALAITAMREYPDKDNTPVPGWIGDLAYGPTPDLNVYNRLMHQGFIAWNNGWRLTGTGWQALNAASPRGKGTAGR